MRIGWLDADNLSAYAAGFAGLEGRHAWNGPASVPMGASGPDKVPASAKKLAQHAIKHSFWAILPALGECFHTIAIDSRRWANFVAPMLLTAPQDETASTNPGPSVRLHETHDAFAR